MKTIKEAIYEMFKGFGVDDKERMAVYYKALHVYPKFDVINRLIYFKDNWQPRPGEKIPSIKEIKNSIIDRAETLSLPECRNIPTKEVIATLINQWKEKRGQYEQDN